MSVDLGSVGSRELLGELARRVPGLARRLVASRGRTPRADAGSVREPFATLERAGRPPVPLWSGYRSSIKPGWIRYYWPVDVLLRLNARVALAAPLQALATELRGARTLPRALSDIAAEVSAAAVEHQRHITRSDDVDALTGLPALAMIPSRAEVRAIAEYHEARASRMLARLARAGVRVDRVRALEIGCGTGYTTLALGVLGVRESVGVDLASTVPGGRAERDAVAAHFAARTGGASRSRLEQGDAHALPFADGTFDLVHNASAVEHVRTPSQVFREAARVLAPGGFALFDVDPWFGPQGGHSLCTLDFPWGHVRLAPEAFAAYAARHRPHELQPMLDFYRDGFQQPRQTAGEIEAVALDAGFVILDWQDSKAAHGDHTALLSAAVLAECREQFPGVTARDLTTSGYTMLLRKR